MSSNPPSAALVAAYAHCEALVKAADKAAWLAALFAPEATRPPLHALHAFVIEVDAVRGKVREPLAGELRLQWWVDAIEGEARGDVGGNPVAAALLDTVVRFRLSRAALTGLIEVRRPELYDEAPVDLADFNARADQTQGAMIALGLRILDAETEASRAAALHAGRVLAVTRAIVALGALQAGRMAMYLPQAVLAQHGIGTADVMAARPTPAIQRALAAMQNHAAAELAALRTLRRTLPPAAAPAFLTTSVAARRLKLMRKAQNPFAPPPDLLQWRKQWILWRAAGQKGIL